MTIDGETGVVDSTIVWLADGPHPALATTSAVITTSHPTTHTASPAAAPTCLPLVNVVNNAPPAAGAAHECKKAKGGAAKVDWASTFNGIASLAWPLALLIGLALFRNDIRALFSRVPGSVDKISIMNFSVEFAKVRELAPRWGEDANFGDLRRSSSAYNVSNSTLPAFSEQLSQTTPVDYVVVDLGAGLEWLTSRLFILSLLLRRTRGLKALVFVERTAETRRKFVGYAHPDRVRWALAGHYEWLEPAFASAYDSLIQEQAGVIKFTFDEGRMEYSNNPQASPALDLLRKFLERIQRPTPTPTPAPGPAQPEVGWVAVGQANQEHAHWIDADLLEDVLGNGLETAAVSGSDLRGKPRAEQIKLVLGQRGRFVAVTREGGRFDYLIDRMALTDRLAEELPAG